LFWMIWTLLFLIKNRVEKAASPITALPLQSLPLRSRATPFVNALFWMILGLPSQVKIS
jgi:hypothetical protein